MAGLRGNRDLYSIKYNKQNKISNFTRPQLYINLIIYRLSATKTMTVFKNYYNRKYRWTLDFFSCLYLLCSTISCITATGDKVRHYHMKISGSVTKDFEESSKSFSCPNCFHESETEKMRRETDELRLEAIKKQILQKLGLRHKPNVTRSLPKDIILETLNRAKDDYKSDVFFKDFDKSFSESSSNSRVLEQQEPDEFYGRMSEIIIFAEQGKLT